MAHLQSEAVYLFFGKHTKQCISMIIFLVFILVCNNFVSHPPDSPSAQHVLTTQILVVLVCNFFLERTVKVLPEFLLEEE